MYTLYIIRGAAAFPFTQCPLQGKPIEMGSHLLTEIEAHVNSNSSCHHSLQELFFHGSSDIDGATPLLLACQYGELDCVKHIVENWGVDVNSSGVYYLNPSESHVRILGATPLFVAEILHQYKHLFAKVIPY